MKVKCGTDIIEINRIKNSITELGDRFKNKVFTENEVAYCEGKNKQKYQHYAGRFAGKEAVFKAISESLTNKFEISWQDIEIVNDDDGRPMVNLPEKYMHDIECIDISISHCKEYAQANVVVLYK